MLIPFSELPVLSTNRFQPDNGVRWLHIPQPATLDLRTGEIVVDSRCKIIGWSDSLPERLMYGREGQIGLMLFHPEYEEIWQHYPLFDDEERAAAVFRGELL